MGWHRQPNQLCHRIRLMERYRGDDADSGSARRDEGGGYILVPSGHFFEAEPVLLATFAEEARACVYFS